MSSKGQKKMRFEMAVLCRQEHKGHSCLNAHVCAQFHSVMLFEMLTCSGTRVSGQVYGAGCVVPNTDSRTVHGDPIGSVSRTLKAASQWPPFYYYSLHLHRE